MFIFLNVYFIYLFILFLCHQCKCWPGFFLKSDGKTCVDTDECSTTLPCSQQCINTYGSYKCLCVDGYEALERNPNTCKALSGKSTLGTLNTQIFRFQMSLLKINSSHFSRRAVSHYGGQPRHPEAERGWLKLHNPSAG